MRLYAGGFQKYNTTVNEIVSNSLDRRKKLEILEQFGFRKDSDTVKATLLNLHPIHPLEKYRT